MTRVTGPESGSRLAYGIRSAGELATAGTLTRVVYADAGGTILADILTTGGAPISGSVVTIGTDSQIPLFQFPDGVDTVYISVAGGPVTPIYTRVVASGGGGGTPSGTVVTETAYGQASSAGAASAYSRGDHTHGSPSLTANAAGTSAVGDTAAVGTGTAPARDDHRHAREAFGSVTAQTSYGASSANGTAVTVSHSDHAHGTPALTVNNPTTSAVGDSPAVGSGTAAAKDDHKHGRESFGGAPGTTEGIGQSSAAGVATTPSRSDHVHPMAAAGAPVASAIGDTQSTGVATTFAASDHRHAREALGGAPSNSAVGDSAAAGSGTTNARVDHVHGREAFATPGSSAVGDSASAGAATTVSRSDHRHGREAFATPVQVDGTTAAGAATTVARSDHQHGLDTFMHLDHGALAWNMPPYYAPGSTALGAPFVAGTVFVAKIPVPAAVTVSSIWMQVNTAGGTLTSGQCFAALFDGSKNLLQTTADQSAAWNTGGPKQMAITSQALSAGFCYVGWFWNGTTVPRFLGTVSGLGTLLNFNLSAANSIWASADTGRTTTMPATLGAFTSINQGFWVALS